MDPPQLLIPKSDLEALVHYGTTCNTTLTACVNSRASQGEALLEADKQLKTCNGRLLECHGRLKEEQSGPSLLTFVPLAFLLGLVAGFAAK